MLQFAFSMNFLLSYADIRFFFFQAAIMPKGSRRVGLIQANKQRGMTASRMVSNE